MIYAIENQSLLDVAIQEDGSVLTAFDWAFKNGLSLTDELAAGQKLVSPNSIFRNADVANYFKGKKQMVATGLTIDQINNIKNKGIGYMKIGSTFIIG